MYNFKFRNIMQKLIKLNKQFLISNFKYSNETKESDFFLI